MIALLVTLFAVDNDIADDSVQHGGFGGQCVAAAAEVLDDVCFRSVVFLSNLQDVIRQALRANVARRMPEIKNGHPSVAASCGRPATIRYKRKFQLRLSAYDHCQVRAQH